MRTGLKNRYTQDRTRATKTRIKTKTREGHSALKKDSLNERSYYG